MLYLTSDKVCVQAISDSDTTPSGLIIPDVAKQRCDQGIIKYIGPDVKDISIGDYVLFGGYDGITIRLEGEGDLILLRESNIKCVILNTIIQLDGLYYRDNSSNIELEVQLKNILSQYADDILDSNTTIKYIIAAIDQNNKYFSATLETALQLITSQMTRIPTKNKFKERESPTETI